MKTNFFYFIDGQKTFVVSIMYIVSKVKLDIPRYLDSFRNYTLTHGWKHRPPTSEVTPPSFETNAEPTLTREPASRL